MRVVTCESVIVCVFFSVVHEDNTHPLSHSPLSHLYTLSSPLPIYLSSFLILPLFQLCIFPSLILYLSHHTNFRHSPLPYSPSNPPPYPVHFFLVFPALILSSLVIPVSRSFLVLLASVHSFLVLHPLPLLYFFSRPHPLLSRISPIFHLPHLLFMSSSPSLVHLSFHHFVLLNLLPSSPSIIPLSHSTHSHSTPSHPPLSHPSPFNHVV